MTGAIFLKKDVHSMRKGRRWGALIAVFGGDQRLP
ncbi:hypothetical protein PhaeoP30_02756 [Phaeobacter inhibens]|nr:hypothetical protein PhaeoP30_02756 [Phaeobacter inhibens]